MAGNLSTYATRAVPRYTSYPTAPHFCEGVGHAEQARWLAALNPTMPVSLYIHVPFCRDVCWYCGCNMKLAVRRAPLAAFVDDVISEIEHLAAHLPCPMSLSHIHFGGGTPTALRPADLARIVTCVRTRFDIEPNAELAIESDPRSLTDKMIETIGALGFTRASIGVQEFSPIVQAAINRIQPPEMVKRAVDGFRAAGLTGINFDLVYGLPHQTVSSLVETIGTVAKLAPDRLALFGYAHVPWMAKRQRLIDAAALPGAAARLMQARAAQQAILSHGFEPVGLDHFARPDDPLAVAARDGTVRRNFQGYTTDRAQTLLGVGPSAIGRTPGGYVQNFVETGAWSRGVAQGLFPIAKGVALTADDRLRAFVIEELMCRGDVDLAEAGRQHGAAFDWFVEAEPELHAMARDGVIVRTGDRITVADDARHLVRTVASAFDVHLATRRARHSLAV